MPRSVPTKPQPRIKIIDVFWLFMLFPICFGFLVFVTLVFVGEEFWKWINKRAYKAGLILVFVSIVSAADPYVERSFSPTKQSNTWNVTLTVYPSTSSVFGILDEPPTGWSISNPSQGCGSRAGWIKCLEGNNNSEKKVFTYIATQNFFPPRKGEFVGVSSFDGSSQTIRGPNMVPTPMPMSSSTPFPLEEK